MDKSDQLSRYALVFALCAFAVSFAAMAFGQKKHSCECKVEQLRGPIVINGAKLECGCDAGLCPCGGK